MRACVRACMRACKPFPILFAFIIIVESILYLQFIRDELNYKDGFDRQSVFHGSDDLISVSDLWHLWINSPGRSTSYGHFCTMQYNKLLLCRNPQDLIQCQWCTTTMGLEKLMNVVYNIQFVNGWMDPQIKKVSFHVMPKSVFSRKLPIDFTL